MHTCLVTGASGFVGRVLCQRLCDQGFVVRSLIRRQIPGDCPWHETIIADIASGSCQEDAFANVDTVFHLAARVHAVSEIGQDDEEYRRVNTEGTRKLLQKAQAKGVQRFIYFSSVKAAGEGAEILQDETSRLLPLTSYGRSKREAEKLVIEGKFVSHPVVIRPSMVYGPTRKGNLPRMIEGVRKRYFPPLPEVHNKRSMIHVNDVVEASILAATKKEAAGQTYIVTDEKVYSTRQMYDWIREALNKPQSSMSVPVVLLKNLAWIGDSIGSIRKKRFLFDSDALDKLLGSAWYSSEKIKSELGFVPAYDLQTSLPEIICSLGRSAT